MSSTARRVIAIFGVLLMVAFGVLLYVLLSRHSSVGPAGPAGPRGRTGSRGSTVVSPTPQLTPTPVVIVVRPSSHPTHPPSRRPSPRPTHRTPSPKPTRPTPSPSPTCDLRHPLKCVPPVRRIHGKSTT